MLLFLILLKLSFLDEDFDECQQNVKVRKLTNDFKNSVESDDDIMVSKVLKYDLK
jgi:hypothetical protein